MITIINAGPGPVVYDEDGHSLAGGERLEVKVLDSAGQRAVEQGHLLRMADDPAKGEPGGEPATGEPEAKRDDSESRSARRTGKS